jgi:FtsH-binding integral membrane protein
MLLNGVSNLETFAASVYLKMVLKLLLSALILLLTSATRLDDRTDTIAITPQILTGIVVMLIIAGFSLVGFAALNNVTGPVTFTPNALVLGKEK